MKSFGEWFRTGGALAMPETARPLPEMCDLPEGIVEYDGVYFATCCQCGKDDPIPVDISEIPQTDYRHYCGGSPYCCP